MTELFHPALLPLAAAVFLPALPDGGRKFLTVAVPLAALALCAAGPHGARGGFEFFGHELSPWRNDGLSALFACVFSLIGAIGAVYALHEDRAAEQSAGLAYLGGALGVTLAGDLLTLFVFWELMALAAAAIVFIGGRPGSAGAGMRYLMMHLFGGVLLLSGILLRAAETGSLAFGPMTADLGSPAAWLILAGFLLNAAAPPLGAWLPDAYPRASVTGAILLTAYTTKSAVYALIRGFPGAEPLIWLGAVMTIYGVVYAMLENDARRLLSYHIISQVGYMVCGAGIGTQLALNGAAALAVGNILYKGLLFMAAGAVLHVTGKSRLSELSSGEGSEGPLWRKMPATAALYLAGAAAISSFPLFSGFVSKAMTVSAAGETGAALPYLLLTLAAAGTFLSVGLKLPYNMFFRDSTAAPKAKEPPPNMLAAMALAAALCLLPGLFPGLLYSVLPFPTGYQPYTAAHVVAALGTLGFTALGFIMFLPRLVPAPSLSLDTDWFYRRGAASFMRFLHGPLSRGAEAARRFFFGRLPAGLARASENPRAFLGIAALSARLYFSTPGAEAALRERLETALKSYPGEACSYRPVGSTVLWVILFLAGYLALYYIAN
ncbi:MAG: multicomponent Na+:H+ antiporter subunit D [Elusimicrobia bacterium]|nr:MAG: multicomponent Na+:H+ antiporter subunit D [Elusimicrobiota bacterium]KAF0157326.1 MAG: multicomponent Na+:H+ antiporter subunit D [Elusimicrobiota bacterium]